MSPERPRHPPDPVPHNAQIAFMFLVVLVAGAGFVYKFMEFSRTAIEGELLGFAVVPLLVYLLIASGFACLLFWAVSAGHFKDVEKQKDRMMDYALGGDDPPPRPHPGFAGLDAGARLGNGAFVLSTAALLWFLMWTMFQPPVTPVGPVAVASHTPAGRTR